MKVVAICDEDTGIGLRLAGVHEVYIPEKEARELFNEIVTREDVAVLFVSERIADTLSREIKDYILQEGGFPIIVEIPGKEKIERVDLISLLIKRAVGVEIERKAL
jgi:vacuolar-type H+-ATPase subunit F/Vma7